MNYVLHSTVTVACLRGSDEVHIVECWVMAKKIDSIITLFSFRSDCCRGALCSGQGFGRTCDYGAKQLLLLLHTCSSNSCLNDIVKKVPLTG